MRPSWRDAGSKSILTLADATKYANPKNTKPTPPLTKRRLKDIQMGVLFSMLYAMLVGINLLAALTKFGFNVKQVTGPGLLPQGGCPIPFLRLAIRGGCNKYLKEALIFITEIIVTGAFGLVMGCWILASYNVYGDHHDNDNVELELEE